jgi:hypothetical protein
MRLVLAGFLLLAASSLAQAGEGNPTGRWKVTIVEEGQTMTFWIVQLENKDGKLTGKATSLKRVPPTTVEEARVKGDMLQFDLLLSNKIRFAFEGKLPASGGKKIYGSFGRGAQVIPVVLEASTAKNQFELDRDTLLRTPNDPRTFGAVVDLLKNAKAEKVPANDVQEWTETALRAAEDYGPRFHGDLSARLLDALTSDYPGVAVTVGRQLEAGLDPKAPALTHLRLLNILVPALKKSGQEAQAKQVEARMDKLENVAYAEYQKTALDFPVEKFPGRKSKSNRAVLVELFTGAQCPPCVAADMAFDALEKSYKPSEVVLLQYHLHVPGPDPLTNPDTETRQEYYGSVVKGTPAILFNGKSAAPGGGGRDDAPDKFKEYQSVVNSLLEKETTLQLSAQAARKGNKIHIQALAKDVDKPGDQVRLRLALVEDWVRYKSPNGLFYHHRVVRALPGGPKGTTLTKKEGELSAVVDVQELQDNLARYLDDFARKEEPFPDSQKPLRLRNLHVVAFVQDDASSEVLQAVDVPIRDE